MKNHYTIVHNIVSAAMCLALALVLPFLTGQIPEIGQALAPMHLPVLLCGYICGSVWGAAVGFTAPLLRTALFGMPPFPTAAVPMAFELAVYGLMTGLLFKLLPKRNIYIYVSLIGAMVSGRIVWGIVKFIMTVVKSGIFTFAAFIAGTVTTAIPGIICQIVLVPLIVIALKRAKVILED